MIGSFWNLCRACPSMPVDKLHSEYRSTYRWHEYTGGSRPEVIRRPPIANQFASSADHFFSKSTEEEKHVEGTCNEPAMPRRKKCPELAYKTHEFINCDQSTVPTKNDFSTITRARSESRGTPSRRSKSEGPHRMPNGGIYPIGDCVVDAVPDKTISGKAATVQELEPLVRDGDDKPVVEKKEQDMFCNRKKLRPNSQYAMQEIRQKHAVTEKENFGFSSDKKDSQNKTLENGIDSTWYKDVIELRKKAGEYKHRGWGVEMQPDVLNKQKELWDQVSRRSSLSALSLASATHRPISKEEKEKENNKKSSPTKPYKAIPGQVHFVDNKLTDGFSNRFNVRHHLERTTGPDVEEGALLPSPTREKLMPTIPKSKDDESYNSQRGSPKKSTSSKHGSPQKGSPKKSPKKVVTKQNKGRSQSVGPVTAASTDGSPKRQARSGSAVPAMVVNAAAASTAKSTTNKKAPIQTPTIVERRPRPTTLSTSIHSRSKSSSLPPNGRSHSAHYNQTIQNDTNKLSPSTLSIPNLQKSYKSTKHQRPKSAIINGPNDPMTESTIKFYRPDKLNKKADKKTAENDDDTEKDGGNSISSASPLPAQEIIEHIVKSPPEPTRVKSPEQVIMRSPDPVNWTVPLDTGKTFTVTQNVRDGEPIIRPHSEFKASTPVDKPPTAPMSAPPELAEPAKPDAWNNDKEHDISDSDSLAPSKSTVVSNIRYDKPVPGSTLRCLDDPTFDSPDATAAVVSKLKE